MRFVASTFATAVDVYGQLAGNHEGEGSHGKEGKAAKPNLSDQIIAQREAKHHD